jgi:UrcA family protein
MVPDKIGRFAYGPKERPTRTHAPDTEEGSHQAGRFQLLSEQQERFDNFIPASPNFDQSSRTFTLVSCSISIERADCRGPFNPTINRRTAMNWLNANRPPLRWLFAVSALSLGLVAEHALAGDPVDAPSVKVSYADLDLSRQQGTEVLYRRIQSAARSVCGRVDSREIARYRLFRQCYEEAIELALKEINRSNLYAMHKPSSRRLEALAATMR